MPIEPDDYTTLEADKEFYDKDKPRCAVCGSVISDGCHLVGGKVKDNPNLTKEDWESIYDFMRFIFIPFIHGVEAQANNRKAKL